MIPPTPNADEIAIKQLGEEYFAATNAGNAERCIATMAPDVVIMPPERPIIFGHEQLRALAHGYHATYDLSYSLMFDEVETHGDWGFVRATVSGNRTAPLNSFLGGMSGLSGNKATAIGNSGASFLIEKNHSSASHEYDGAAGARYSSHRSARRTNAFPGEVMAAVSCTPLRCSPIEPCPRQPGMCRITPIRFPAVSV